MSHVLMLQMLDSEIVDFDHLDMFASSASGVCSGASNACSPSPEFQLE